LLTSVGDFSRVQDSITPEALIFLGNPNTPSTFSSSLDTRLFEDSLTAMSTIELGHMDTETTSRFPLSWTNESEIEPLTSAIENLRVVGWHSIDEE